MPQFEVIDVEVRFLAPEEGGLQAAPRLDGTRASSYRPHLVVGDSTHDVHWPDGSLGKDYIGVAFVGGPNHVSLGETVAARCIFMFPDQDNSGVVPGATFTLREGARIVAEGKVVSRDVELLA
jgi:hypothetical protein